MQAPPICPVWGNLCGQPMAYCRASDGGTVASAMSTTAGSANTRTWDLRVKLRNGAKVGVAAALSVRDNLCGADASFTPRSEQIASAVRSMWVFSFVKVGRAVLYRWPTSRTSGHTPLRRIDFSSTSERTAPSSQLRSTNRFPKAFSVTHA